MFKLKIYKTVLKYFYTMKKIPPKASIHPDSLHTSMAFVILVAQFFGMMPLYGITKDYRNITFKFKSIRFLYSALNLIGASTCAIFGCLQFATMGVILTEAATLSYYICNCFTIMYFMRMARNWRALIAEWSKVEESMKLYEFPTNLKRTFKVITVVILFLASVEHLFFVLNTLSLTWRCQNQTIEIYFKFAFPQVFSIVSYSHWKALLVEIVNILATFCWNFLDLFIILMSSAIALRFKQVSRKIKIINVNYDTNWKEIREDYDRLMTLCSRTDKHIGPLVMISFVSNLFFICIQLYNTLIPRYGILSALYFFYSFGFLLTRTLAVSIYAAWINDESKKPLKVLHSIPSEYYCEEIERLLQQIHMNPAGITGSNFFLITRSLLLKIAGTIVTFELMLLQFGPLLQKDFNHLSTSQNIDYSLICVPF